MRASYNLLARFDKLPAQQAELASWTLRHLQGLLETGCGGHWDVLWKDVVDKYKNEFYDIMPSNQFPKRGFGDAATDSLVACLVQATADTGAIRHGSECFNYFFPQALDRTFLVIDPEFQADPFRVVTEKELVDFLWKRLDAGFSFPLHPVCAVEERSK